MLTVIIATYNGASTIKRTLDQMTNLEEPDGGWKLIVVDNGSTDETREIVQSFVSLLPLSLETEPNRGKNNALNSVLEKIEGDLVVFTDDDVLPDKHWLSEIRNAADQNKDVTLFGGRIEPEWMKQPGADLLAAIPCGPAFAITPEDRKTGPTRCGRIWGPNMAVRSHIFASGFQFDGAVGPSTGQYRMGSETEFLQRLEREGHKAMWIDEAIVKHIIRENQVTEEWLHGRAFRFGRAAFHSPADNPVADRTTRYLFGCPRWMIRRYMTVQTEKHLAIFTGNQRKVLERNWKIGELRGMMYEARNLAKNGT